MKVEIVALHGWGFCAGSWSALALPGEWSVEAAERGYFGEQRHMPVFAGSASRKAIVTHSLGLHLCSKELIAQADLIVIVSGFSNFVSQSRPHADRILQRMKNKLSSNPIQVLSDFHDNCFNVDPMGSQPESALLQTNLDTTHINKQALLEDLELLRTSVISPSLLNQFPHALILHGGQDNIVSRQAAKFLQSSIPSATLRIHDHAGHGLPFSHAAWCVEEIVKFTSAV